MEKYELKKYFFSLLDSELLLFCMRMKKNLKTNAK